MMKKVKLPQFILDLPKLKSTKISNALKKTLLLFLIFFMGLIKPQTETASADNNTDKTDEWISYFKNAGYAISPEVYIAAKQNDYPAFVRAQVNEQLITEVQEFVRTVAPLSKMDAREIVRVCNNYDLDIIFVLAQGLLESHFGTKGVAIRTNSVFNVGAYDSGHINPNYVYKDPNESIEPYAKLLNEKYLVDDKTLNSLLTDKGFINYEGKRYATDTKYEPLLRTTMVRISLETNISMYQDIYNLSDEKIIAYFRPINNEINLLANK